MKLNIYVGLRAIAYVITQQGNRLVFASHEDRKGRHESEEFHRMNLIL